MTQNKKTLVAFATGWGPQFGGINSFNADLLPAVAAAFEKEVKTVCVVPHASSADIDAASSKNVSLVSLDLPGTREFSAELETKVSQALQDAGIQASTAETVWLGHDRITGAIALRLAKTCGGRSALIHHMSYRHYEAFAENSAQASSKLAEQKNLFAPADIVLAVGPLLRDALRDMFDCKKVHMLVPGFPEITHRTEPRTFNAFLSGRLDDSARKIKQAYLGVAAFGEAISRCTEDCGLPDALHRDKEPWLKLRGVEFEKIDGTIDPEAEHDLKLFAEKYAKGVLTLHALPFTKDRNKLFDDLREASVAMMPSWHEGFGLVAWEAIAAGVPLILSKKSGAYLLLEELQSGLYTNMVQGVSIAGSNTHPYFLTTDLKTLSDALIHIAKNPAIHRTKAAELHRGLLEHCSWSHCAKQLFDALDWNFGDSPATIEPPSNAPTSPTLPTTVVVPQTDISAVRASFASTSTIGRTWHREIAGERIFSPIVNKLLAAIDEGKRAILLTGLPGSGKTCAMLALQDALEQRAKTRTDLVPLFIQSREFADQATSQDRQAQGLPTQWVEQVARMAKEAQVVVVIDSLDVLSIAREHSVLTYFLAQIDRLLLIPNVTVVTACRDFDRKYDHRISVREWDVELKCPALNWDTEIAPLLTQLNIDTKTTDAVTRELIRNPRELALFVELSRRAGSINAVTSHALSQRYLKTIVQDNAALGDLAMQAIEAIADEMLNTRSLTVPRQRFKASPDVLQSLLSHNVLHATQDEKLTFGHQTLLDVLVISGAVRRGVTLNAFIQSLPPVPFVRPCIRSFVAQLAVGERSEFRKQLRTILTGTNPFHIRRLVAESFAEQKPADDDWALINDLRKTHRDVFQVIYTHATVVEWHHFWLKHLVPALKSAHDAEGLATHVRRVQQWKNDDTIGVLAFWSDALTLKWVAGEQIADQLGLYLSQIDIVYVALVVPLLEKLLSLPRQQHSFLGRAIAGAVTNGGASDTLLWYYIAGEISSDDALSHQFGIKLFCQPHEFGDSNDKFLLQRMQQSTLLLDLALASIEQWSQARLSQYGATGINYWNGFLRKTSYNDAHSQSDHHHIDGERVLLDAVEAAVVAHAQAHSDWWQNNRERLCSNNEGALRYFAVLACTVSPEPNISLIAQMLCAKPLLESDLSYELGTLIQAAFVYLAPPEQDAVLAAILSIHEDKVSDDLHLTWVLSERAQLIATIPGYLRSPEAQALMDAQEQADGYVIRQPRIGMRGGIVGAPFSYEVFLNAKNDGVMRLLAHYTGHSRTHGDDFLIGGEREVGWQLREAASLQPTRFLHLLTANLADISESFRNDILDGVANYLAHRYGNLQANATWKPCDEPDAPSLARQIIDELERHPKHWHHNRSASNALQACAHVVTDSQDAARLVSLAIGYEDLREESSIRGDSVDLMTTGINMVRGHVVEALMILANRLLEKTAIFPELLSDTLRRFSTDEQPAIRALVLRRLPFVQSRNPALGWDLFNSAMVDSQGLWESAETSLYYAYHEHFERVAPLLPRIRHEGKGKDLEIWGRISALAALVGHLDFSIFLEELKVLDATEAWWGAAGVWTHPENIRKHREQCLAGIEAGLNARNAHAEAVAGQMDHLFSDKELVVPVPTALIQRHFDVLEKSDKDKHHRLIGLDAWLNITAQHDPEQALAVTEIYLAYVKRTKPYLHDYENNLTQLLTRLFANAEEREESDQGDMLKRVVAVQDTLLGLGVDGIDKWLKAAERP
jgi:glycosyltransferase involved in cell wall biosynthesis